MTHVLTINSGSSSLKFGLFLPAPGDPVALGTGLVERIGSAGARIKLKGADGGTLHEEGPIDLPDHGASLARVLEIIAASFEGAQVAAVGHRVVHGGPDRDLPVTLSAALVDELEQYSPFAPLHQPPNLAGVRAAMERFPGAAQVACFDTAFHRKHPWENDTFAIPRAYYDKGVRRYGFHGLSYDYIAGHLAKTAPLLHAGRVVVAHLGNGASMCGMIDGHSKASSMGFSALDGLPMGTRCGQLDPGVILYLLQQEGKSVDEVVDILYKESGLLGLSGLSNDMRTLEQADTPEARQAIAYFVHRVRREVGAMAAILGGLDALIFTGGIGENSRTIRERVCQDMGWLGIEMSRDANAENARLISTPLSRVRVMAIPTNEELVIARAAARALSETTATAAQ